MEFDFVVMNFDHGGDGSMLFAGGGFMPTQSATILSSDVNSGGGTRPGGSQDSGLQPLTVKMISQATQRPGDDIFYIDGVDVNNVTLVGMVHNKEERNIDTSFFLDDSTGRIQVKRWIDGQDSHEFTEMQAVKNGMYVRVHGHLRTFQNKLHVVAFSVRPITNFNELTFHFLEVIYVHLSNMQTRVPAMGPAPTPASMSTYEQTGFYNNNQVPASGPAPTVVSMSTYGQTGFNSNNQMAAIGIPPTPVGTGTYRHTGFNNNIQYMPPPHVASVASGGSMDDCRRRVHAIFEEPFSLQIEQGLHVNQVVQRVVGYSPQQVRDAVEFLVNEGFVYSTIDDDHYRSTMG